MQPPTPATGRAPDPVELGSIRWRRRSGPMVAAGIVVLIVIAAVFFRQRDVPKYRTMWAEDGRIFAQCLFDRPTLVCLSEPYQGYLHVVPRLAAMVATAGQPVWMPFLFTLSSGVVAAWCAASVALAVRDVTLSTAAGVLAGGSLGLLWQAGREVLGNATNSNAALLVAAVVVLLCTWLGRRLRWWDLVLVAATALSSAFAFLLPILAIGGVQRRTDRARRHLALIAVLAIPQTVVILTATRRVPEGDVSIMKAVTGFRDLVLLQGWFGGRGLPPDWLVPVALVAITILLIALARRPTTGVAAPDRPIAEDPAEHPPEHPAGTGGADRPRLSIQLAVLVALVGFGTVIFFVSVFLNRVVNPRYAYTPAALIAIALAVAGGWVSIEARHRTLPSWWPRSGGRRAGERAPASRSMSGALGLTQVIDVLLLVGLLAMAVGYGLSFRLQSRASPGPNVVAEIERSAHTCITDQGRVAVPISPQASPPLWTVEIPCSRFGP
jgi:hypothetical protein